MFFKIESRSLFLSAGSRETGKQDFLKNGEL